MYAIKVSLMVLILLLVASPAWAKKVYSPIVHKGELELENQNEIFRSKNPAKDGKSKHQLELSYGITDWWHTGIYAVYEQTTAVALAYTESKWVNIFQLTPQGKYGLDVGLYVEYIKPASNIANPDVLELIVLMEKALENWTNTLNLVFKRALWKGGAATDMGFAWRTRYKMDNGLEPAVEAYGGLGIIDKVSFEQRAFLIGPILAYEVSDNVEVDTGWLMAPNEGLLYGDFKLNIEYKF